MKENIVGFRFSTSDIALAAYIACLGYDYRAHLEENTVYFLFVNTHRREKNSFFSGGTIPAKDYYRELKRAKAHVFWLTSGA